MTFHVSYSSRIEHNLSMSLIGLHYSAAVNERHGEMMCWDALTKIALTLASGCYALGHPMMTEEG